MPEPERESFDTCFIYNHFTAFSTFSFLLSSASCIAMLSSEIHPLSLLGNFLLNTNETNANIFCDFPIESCLSLLVIVLKYKHVLSSPNKQVYHLKSAGSFALQSHWNLQIHMPDTTGNMFKKLKKTKKKQTPHWSFPL